MKRFLIAAVAMMLPAATLPTAALATGDVALSSSVFVERTTPDVNGRQRTVLEAPRTVTRGDRLVFVLNYRNVGITPRTDFTITNPLPRPVAFQGTSDHDAIVSIDGGHSWGTLAALRVRESDGSFRGARPEDVTHVRWTLKRAIAAGESGRLTFRGIVR